MQKISRGDLVVTSTQSHLYFGDVSGGTEYTPSPDGRSNVRRGVLWRNADTPLDYAELPANVAAKFQGGGTLIELTAQLADLEAMLASVAGDDEELVPAEQPASIRHKQLDHVPPGSVNDLYITDAWANLVVDLLNERKQLVLYGPPGTGKTYLARKLAERLVGAEQVRLVQFHPAYTYEDFFEGYRPAGSGESGT